MQVVSPEIPGMESGAFIRDRFNAISLHLRKHGVIVRETDILVANAGPHHGKLFTARLVDRKLICLGLLKARSSPSRAEDADGAEDLRMMERDVERLVATQR